MGLLACCDHWKGTLEGVVFWKSILLIMFSPLHTHASEHFVTLCPLEGRRRVTFSTYGLPFSQSVLQKVVLEDILSQGKRAL